MDRTNLGVRWCFGGMLTSLLFLSWEEHSGLPSSHILDYHSPPVRLLSFLPKYTAPFPPLAELSKPLGLNRWDYCFLEAEEVKLLSNSIRTICLWGFLKTLPGTPQGSSFFSHLLSADGQQIKHTFVWIREIDLWEHTGPWGQGTKVALCAMVLQYLLVSWHLYTLLLAYSTL